MVAEPARPETVRLVIPGTADYLRVARVTASAVAARLGYDIDALDDLRIAVDELAGALTAVAGPDPLEIEFEVDAGALVVAGRVPVRDEPSLDDITRRILRAVGGEYSLQAVPVDGRQVGSFRFRLAPPQAGRAGAGS